MSSKPSIAVVGACNFDIYATASHALLPADSNPGFVSTAPGGVGRNIAENLARLGCQTQLLTALGQDAFADAIDKNAAQIGLDLSAALRLPHISTSVYVCVNKPDGDIAVAISDMDSSLQITPAYITAQHAVLDEAALVVADANLPPETIVCLWQQYAHKLCIDCVSTPKCSRVLPALKHLFCLKANRAEASALCGMDIEDSESAARAAELLHAKGVQTVIITLGEHGALVSDRNSRLHMPLMPGETQNTSGCGDAFFAGALQAILAKADIKTILRNGLAMARLCATAAGAVSPTVSAPRLLETLHAYQGGPWQ